MKSCDHQIWNVIKKWFIMMPISSHLSNLPYIVMWPSHLKSISIWPIGATYPIGRCLESCDSYTEYPTNTNIFAHYINIYTGWSHITTPRTQVLLQTSRCPIWVYPGNIMMLLQVCLACGGPHSLQQPGIHGPQKTCPQIRYHVDGATAVVLRQTTWR